jgi:3',5'-cyclic AMP phosphodiesterase CpdA
MSVRIVQISDLHFGREIPRIAEAMREELSAQNPALVAVCGDLTQTAREREFVAAREFLDGITAPALVVPGNHDLPGWRVWSRFTRPWRRWRRHLRTEPYATVSEESPGLVAVGVNTARSWGFHPDWSRGRIDARQVAEVLEAFERSKPEDLRVLVTHHPFLLTKASRLRGMVGRSALALERLRRRCDLLLGGHTHLSYCGAAGGMVVAQSGTAFSNRLKGEPNGYNLIDADGPRLTVTTLQWDGTKFAPAQRSTFERDEDRTWRHADDPAERLSLRE